MLNRSLRTFVIAGAWALSAAISQAADTNYIVFFEYSSAALVSAGKDVAAEAAQAYRAKGGTRIDVVGHTDTAEAATLGADRARAIRDELVRLGVPANAVHSEGRGASEPMVPTPAGVREPMNRRATIVVKGGR